MTAQWKTWHKATVGGLGGATVLLAGMLAVLPSGKHADVQPSPSAVGASAALRPALSDPLPPAATQAPSTPKATKATPGKTTGAPPATVYYANCAAAKTAGAAPLHRGEPGYRSGLDRDGDGVACE